jgi:hypothetical protein
MDRLPYTFAGAGLYQCAEPQQTDSLLDVVIPNADGPTFSIASVDNGCAEESAKVEVIFRDLEARLVAEIERYPRVYGCVAWLTNEPVLQALASKRATSIIVQKEDFLRPDRGWSAQRLRRLYSALPSGSRYEVPGCSYSYSSDDTMPALRCMGNHNSDKSPAWPRMHNKFLVFCEEDISTESYSDGVDEEHWESVKVVPKAVWTGSFNVTKNATFSLENAVLIDNAAVAEAYLAEFALIFGASEPLDWEHQWAAPEFRIGS